MWQCNAELQDILKQGGHGPLDWTFVIPSLACLVVIVLTCMTVLDQLLFSTLVMHNNWKKTFSDDQHGHD
jgi:hypothetical protein